MIESTPHQHQKITKMPNTPVPLNPPRKSCSSRNSNRFVSLFLFDAYSQTCGAHNLSQLQTDPIPHPPTYQNHWNKINEIKKWNINL